MANNQKKNFQPKIDPEYMPNAPKEVLDKLITELNLYPDTVAKLQSVGLNTVFDIARIEMKYIYRIENVTRKDVFAVLRGLHSLGLDFKQNPNKVTTDGEDDKTIESKADNSQARVKNNESRTNANSTPREPRKNPNRNENRNDSPRNASAESNPNANQGQTKPQDRRADINRDRQVDNRNRNNKAQPPRDQPRERVNSYDGLHGNGGRERVNSRDFEDGKRRNERSNERSDRNDRNKRSAEPQKKPPIKLPPLVIPDGLYKFFRLGKWGYKDDKDVVKIEPQFDEAYNFSEGMAGVEIHERVGFINLLGELVIPAIYDTACSFTEGLASVTKDNKCGYINKLGEFVYPMEYDSATPFKDGSALIKREGKWCFINRETGELRPR